MSGRADWPSSFLFGTLLYMFIISVSLCVEPHLHPLRSILFLVAGQNAIQVNTFQFRRGLGFRTRILLLSVCWNRVLSLILQLLNRVFAWVRVIIQSAIMLSHLSKYNKYIWIKYERNFLTKNWKMFIYISYFSFYSYLYFNWKHSEWLSLDY